MVRLRQFAAICRLTALEVFRQPVGLLLVVCCIVLIALVPLLTMHSFGEDGRLARDGGFALHLVFGLFLAGYAASSSLSGEIRRGTASAVLSKPVSPELFLLAKFGGVAAVVLVFSICAALATLLSERVAEKFVAIPGLVGYVADWQTGSLLLAAPFTACLLAALINYRTRRPFGSTALMLLPLCLLLVLAAAGLFDRSGAFAPFDLRVQWRIVPVSLLLAVALLVMSALAVVLSTRLGTAPTVTLCAVALALGLLSDYLFGRHAAGCAAARCLHRVLPNWQHFWVTDALSGGGAIPWAYVSCAALYAALYTAGLICLGMALFHDAEMTHRT